MLKDVLVGLSLGIVAGAFIARNNRQCADAVDALSEAAESKMKDMNAKKSKSKASAE